MQTENGVSGIFGDVHRELPQCSTCRRATRPNAALLQGVRHQAPRREVLRGSLPLRTPAPLRSETRTSFLDLLSEAGKDLFRRSGLGRAGIYFVGTAAYFVQPCGLNIWVRRAVELFPKHAQQRLFLSRAEGTNLVLNYGKRAGHALDGTSDDIWSQHTLIVTAWSSCSARNPEVGKPGMLVRPAQN